MAHQQLKCHTTRTDYSVDYNVFAVDMKHHRPAVVDDVHRLGVWMYEFSHDVWAFSVGSGGIRKSLYLAEDAADEIVSARRLVLAGDVFDNFVKVAAGLIAHYHRVA